MTNQPIEKLNINFKIKRIHGKFCVYNFVDNEHSIAYMPSLNLTGYGDNFQEANDFLLNHSVKDFFNGLFTLPQHNIIHELEKLGWEKSHFFKKDFSKSAYVDKEGVLREFNLPAETKIESELLAVA